MSVAEFALTFSCTNSGLVEQIFGALPDHRQAQQNLPEEGMPEQLLPEEHMLSEPYGLQRQSPASAAEQTTILSSLFGTPAPHASQSFDPSTSASLGWTSLSNFELAHSAVNSALRNQSAPGQPEDNVAGPFVILPPDLTAMNKLPTLYGPIDPAIVPTHPPAVICKQFSIVMKDKAHAPARLCQSSIRDRTSSQENRERRRSDYRDRSIRSLSATSQARPTKVRHLQLHRLPWHRWT